VCVCVCVCVWCTRIHIPQAMRCVLWLLKLHVMHTLPLPRLLKPTAHVFRLYLVVPD
jgi:hypothetical protein